jgi:hypothetical protein
MGPAEPRTKNLCAGEGQQQFTRNLTQGVKSGGWWPVRGNGDSGQENVRIKGVLENISLPL